MLKGFNRHIACVPVIEQKAVEAKVTSGFATVKQKNTLQALKVVFGAEGIFAGDTVYLLGEVCVHKWFTQVYEIGGGQFVLVPIDQVKLVDSPGSV